MPGRFTIDTDRPPLRLVPTLFGPQVEEVYTAEQKRLQLMGDALVEITKLENRGVLSADVAQACRREVFEAWLTYAREDKP